MSQRKVGDRAFNELIIGSDEKIAALEFSSGGSAPLADCFWGCLASASILLHMCGPFFGRACMALGPLL